MKTIWHVYELYNLVGTVEWVGESMELKGRLRQHKSKNGKFYGRADIQMNVVKEFDNKKDAWDYQCQLQNYYGLKTDSEKISETHKGKPKSAEQRLRLSLARKGKTHTDETKLKIGLASKGRIYKPHSEEHKLKIGLALKGKTISEETKLKLSLAAKLDWVKRKSNPSTIS
jgi:predicted GIY-YIG superfamily endonuclease